MTLSPTMKAAILDILAKTSAGQRCYLPRATAKALEARKLIKRGDITDVWNHPACTLTRTGEALAKTLTTSEPTP